MSNPGDIVKRLQNFDPQPIEPGYLGDGIAKLMDEAASLILSDAEKIDTLRNALTRARDMLQSVAGDIEDGHALTDMRGKYVLAVLGARDAAYGALQKTKP